MLKKLKATDNYPLTSFSRTDNGYLLVTATFARSGFQKRLGAEISPAFVSTKLYTELRTKEEVLKDIERWEKVLLTNDHPTEQLNPNNTKALAVGNPLGKVKVEEGENLFLTLDFLVYDAETIAEIEAGKTELSAGYTYDLEAVEGEEYDFLQKSIVPNHIALVHRGRCGASCSIANDEDPTSTQKENTMKEIIFYILLNGKKTVFKKEEVAQDQAQALQTLADELFEKQEAQAKELQMKLDELQAKLDNAPKPATDADIQNAIEVKAKELSSVLLVASDCAIETDGKTAQELKKEVVAKLNPALALDGKSDEYLNASYDNLVTQAKEANHSFQEALNINPANDGVDVKQKFNQKYGGQ